MKEKHINRLKEFFEVHPEENECILFSDGQIFTLKNKNYAQMFEKQSGNLRVNVTRSEVIGVATQPKTTKTPSGKKDNQAGSNGFDIETAKKADLIAFAEENNIEVNKRDKIADIREVIKTALTAVKTPESETDDIDNDESQGEGDDYEPVK